MKTVNELAFGMKSGRTKAEQELYITTMRNCADPYVHATVRNAAVKVAPKLKNFGEASILELIGALGIWLSQFSESQAEVITMVRRTRQQSEAVEMLRK